MDPNKNQLVQQIGESNMMAMENGQRADSATTQFAELAQQLQSVAEGLSQSGLGEAANLVSGAVERISLLPQEIAEIVSSSDNSAILLEELQNIAEILREQKLDPQISVQAPQVNVDAPNLQPVIDSIKKIEIPKQKDINFDPVLSALKSVQSAISNLRFPVPNYVLPFKNTQGAATQVQLDGSGNLPVSATIDTTGLATSSNQTSGAQKSQIVDAGGDAATVTGGKLDVNATIDTTGLATSAKQDTGNTSLATIAGAVAGTEMQVDVLTMPTTTVQATNLDIRDLSSASDSVTIVPSGTQAVSGTVTANPSRPSTATLANVTMTGSSVTIQASNANRLGWTIFNDSGVTVYVKFGSSASSTSFTVKLIDQAYYEAPAPMYTGIITAFGASGDVRVTETTA